MKEKNFVDEIVRSGSVHHLAKTVKQYTRWIVIAGVTLFILAVVILILIVMALFKLVASPVISSTPELTKQGELLIQEGSKWWEQQTNQEQVQVQQLQQMQQQLQELQKTVEQPVEQEVEETTN